MPAVLAEIGGRTSYRPTGGGPLGVARKRGHLRRVVLDDQVARERAANVAELYRDGVVRRLTPEEIAARYTEAYIEALLERARWLGPALSDREEIRGGKGYRTWQL